MLFRTRFLIVAVATGSLIQTSTVTASRKPASAPVLRVMTAELSSYRFQRLTSAAPAGATTDGAPLAFSLQRQTTGSTQDPAAIESALGLDHPTRRLIQEGLRNDGIDPGPADGSFGPRTRAAIRAWQTARQQAETGYLDGAQADALRAAAATAAPPPAANVVAAETSEAEPLHAADAPPLGAEAVEPAAPAGVEAPAAPAAAVLSPGDNAPAAPAARNAQLPPEILVDRRLVRVERLLAEDDPRAAHQVMNEILSLQRQHALALPGEFHFKYAQVAFAAGLAETAVASVNEYLLAAGRDGEFYRDALELLDSAEAAVRRTEAERRRAEAARRRAEALQQENDDLARRQVEVASVPLPRDPLRSGGLAPEMVTVAAGRLQYATHRNSMLRPHLEWVTFDRPFAIGKYEVTRGEFERFVDRTRYRTEARRDPGYGCNAPSTSYSQRNSGLRWNRPGFDQTDRHPVTCVSIRDAVAYARWLSQETGQSYRLPSNAEWQYAERAGSPAAMIYSNRYQTPDVCRYAHRGDCVADDDVWSDGYTVEAGSFPANDIGLHDMIGNVEEFLLACLHDGDSLGTPHGSRENPEDCTRSVLTVGSSWYILYTRSSLRMDPRRHTERYHPDASPAISYIRNSQTWTGFRLVRELPAPGGVQ